MNRLVVQLTLLWLATVCGTAWGQTYPIKSVRMLVGYSAGGSVDILARTISQKLSSMYPYQVIVENRPGAGGNIAGAFVAKSTPDGYTLFLSSGGGLGTNMAIYTKMSYDPLKDLTPIVLLVYQGNVLIVNPKVPAKSLKELIALAKSRPGQINYGSAGNGTSQHVSAELFRKLTGTKLIHIPYNGGAPALVALLGGEVDIMFQTLPEAIPYIKNGRVRALGVTSSKRSANLPDLPTIAEAGLPGFVYDGFMGIAGPAGMPKDIMTKLNADANKALVESDVKKRLLDAGFEIAGGTPEQLASHMKSETAKIIKLAKEAGIKPVD